MAAVTNVDLFNILVMGFIFNAGLILMIIAFFMDFPKNVAFHAISAILFYELGIIIPSTVTQYYPIGWLFLMLGGTNFFFGAIFGVSGFAEVWKKRKTEEWETEEEWYFE